MPLFLWKKRFLFWLAALSVTALLSGCKGTDSADTEAAAKAFGVDYMQELTVENAEQIVCTQTDTWIVTTAKNDFIYRVDHTAETAKIENIEWQQQEGESLLNLTERNGTIYISVRLADEDTIEIRRRYTGGSFQTIMQTEAADTGWYVVGSGLYVDGDGHIYLAGRTNITRFTKEGTPDCEYKIGAGSGFFTEGDKNTEPAAAEYVAAGADGITLYELNREKAEKKWTLNTTATQIYGIRSSGSDTLCISTKDRLLYIDRESGSLLAQSELVMMGMLSVRAGFYDTEEETLRLCGESSKSTGSLSLGDFSKRDESAEKRTELIFGTAGSSNNDAPDRIKKAIIEFNRTNKDYYITIKVYGGDYCNERLQADMAAGSAPDIIEITSTSTTWSHYESYVRNGYLENLSPYLEQSEYKEDMLWNVLNAFEMDGGLYLLSPQFMLYGILIHPDYEDFIEKWDNEAFLELLKKNQWEKNIFSATGSSPEALLFRAKENFFSWEQKTASFETEEFVSLLALCKEYGEQNWPDSGEVISNWTENERYMYTLCNYVNFCMFSEYLHYTDVYGREYPVYGSPTSSGQVYEIDPASDSCGIYAGSRHKEGAWEFLESLLSDSQQKWLGGNNWGFPVRISMLKEVAEEEKGKNIVTPDRNVLTLTDRDIAVFEDIIYHERLIRGGANVNGDILQVILEETPPYFAGDKSTEEVAHIIQSRVKIILNE